MAGKTSSILVKFTGDTRGLKGATREAGSQLDRFKRDISSAQGATGKFRAAASGAFTAIKQNAGALAVGAGAALVAFGAKAVSSFNDAAIAAGNFADSTGLSYEAASQWISVADDLGLSSETLQRTFLRLNKSIGDGTRYTRELGIEQQYAADGTVDVNATMLNAIDIIGQLPDPTLRAAAAQDVFGRSYADVAEIVLNDSDEIRAALESTSDAQIFDQDEIDKARDYRAAMDRLNDVLTDVTMQVGELLVPVIADAADLLAKLTSGAQDVDEATGGWLSKLGPANNLWSTTMGIWDRGPGSLIAMASSAEETTGAIGDLSGASSTNTEVLEANAEAIADAETALDEHVAALQEQIDATKAAAAAQQEQVDAQRAAADATYALVAAEYAVTDAVTASWEVYADSASTVRERTEADIELAEAAQEVADTQVRLAEETATAAGKTLTATERVDAMNRSLISQASVLDGPQRAALIRHIALVNGIPAERMTMIEAAISSGDLDEAERLLNETSRTRSAAIDAVANTSAAEQALNYAARYRQASIGMAYSGTYPGSPDFALPRGATGGIVTRPTAALIGEAGPEAVVPLDRTPGSSPLRGRLGGSTTIINNYPAGLSPTRVAEASRQYERTQGPL